MARALLGVAILAACGLALVAGQGTQLCDPNKAPGQPWNSLLSKNTYDPASKTSSECHDVQHALLACIRSQRTHVNVFDSSFAVGQQSGTRDARVTFSVLHFTPGMHCLTGMYCVAELYMTWRSPVKSSSDGCLNSYRCVSAVWCAAGCWSGSAWEHMSCCCAYQPGSAVPA